VTNGKNDEGGGNKHLGSAFSSPTPKSIITSVGKNHVFFFFLNIKSRSLICFSFIINQKQINQSTPSQYEILTFDSDSCYSLYVCFSS
jgi:hypothetical protein